MRKSFLIPPPKVPFDGKGYSSYFDYTAANYSAIVTRNDHLEFQVSGQPFLSLVQIGQDKFITFNRKVKLTFTAPVNGVFSKILFQKAGSDKVDTLSTNNPETRQPDHFTVTNLVRKYT